MGMFRCWSVKNILDLYLDKRLSENAAAGVETHLKDCEDCAAEAEEMGGVSRFLGEDAEIVMPKGLEESILENLKIEMPTEMEPHTLPRLTATKVFAMLYLVALAGTHTLPGAPSQGHGTTAQSQWERMQ